MTMHAKILASTLASCLALPVALTGASLVLLAPAQADAAVSDATCRIHAVEATETGDGTIPKDLGFLKDQLEAPEFARYKSFRLLESKDFKLTLNTVVEERFKSGHSVKLSLLGGDKDKLELSTDLMRSGTSLVNMNFSMRSNQIVLIPVRRSDSMVIFAYQCKAG